MVHIISDVTVCETLLSWMLMLVESDGTRGSRSLYSCKRRDCLMAYNNTSGTMLPAVEHNASLILLMSFQQS